MSVSVVVVTWNGLHLLRPCLFALAAQSLPHELVVVDNGSTDGSVAWVRQTFPSAHLVVLPRNLGFAGGNNAGLRVAAGDLLVLVNNDTLPPPDFLDELTSPLRDHPGAGSSAGVLTFAHRPHIVASAGIVPGRDGVHRDSRALTSVDLVPSSPEELFGPSGGAVCYRRSALEDVGLFPDRYFMYLEDADLAWRLRLRGWTSLLAPQAHIPHIYSATAGHFSPVKQRLLALNRWRVLLRCVPTDLLARCAGAIVRYDLLAMLYGGVSGKKAIIQGRLEALRELPLLMHERRGLQAQTTVETASLKGWLAPAPSVLQILRESRALEAALRM